MNIKSEIKNMILNNGFHNIEFLHLKIMVIPKITFLKHIGEIGPFITLFSNKVLSKDKVTFKESTKVP